MTSRSANLALENIREISHCTRELTGDCGDRRIVPIDSTVAVLSQSM